MTPYAKAAVGSSLVGIGGALILQAGREVQAGREPCVGCGEDGVEDIAAASAEIDGTEEVPAGDTD